MTKFQKMVKKYLPKLVLFFLGLSLLIFFVNPVNNLLNHLLVERIISTYSNTPFHFLLLAISCTLICLWMCLFGEERLLRNIAASSIIVYIVFLSSGYWIFQPAYFSESFRNWDIVVLALCLPSFIAMVKFTKQTPEAAHPSGFIEDLPVTDKEHDSFNRSGIAKDIAERIATTNNQKSFAIGILGEYGSGKTSFINLIKAQSDNNLIETMDFNPWTGEGSENIHRDFFDLLSSTLYEIDPKISSLVLDYSRKVAGGDSLITKIFKQAGLIGSLINRKSYIDDYERINRLLAASGKKVVVAIDDLDRLYKEEVLEVLRLIRNTANFSNIFYIVAYDRGYIDEAVSSLNNSVNSSFLDKIFQMEIPLPKRQDEDLFILLEQHLKTFISEDDFQAYTNNILRTGFRLKTDFSIEKIFRQARDVVKFINTFRISYEKLGGEVLFENLFVLELIKFRFPLIYDRLYDSREEFIHTQTYNTLQSQFYEVNTYKEDKEDVLDIARTLRQEKKYSEADIALISGLLKYLFFKFDYSKNAKSSIIYPMFFDRYFRYRLSAKDISEKDFQAAFAGGLDTLKVFIDQCTEKELIREVAARLFQIDAKSRAEYELQVKGLFYAGPLFVEQLELNRFDYEDLMNLLRNFEHDRDKKYYEKDESAFNIFVESMFDSAVYPYRFEHELTYHIRKNSWNISIPKEKLIQLQLDYFNEYIKQTGFTEEAVHMFYWTSHEKFIPLPEDTNRGHKLRFIEPKMVEALKNTLPMYDPKIFLKHTIEYDMRDNGIYRIYREIIDMFDKPEELRILAESNIHLSREIKEEYLRFFDANNDKGFGKWTEFTFNTELRRGRSAQD